jgi:hypothetical protein
MMTVGIPSFSSFAAAPPLAAAQDPQPAFPMITASGLRAATLSMTRLSLI